MADLKSEGEVMGWEGWREKVWEGWRAEREVSKSLYLWDVADISIMPARRKVVV